MQLTYGDRINDLNLLVHIRNFCSAFLHKRRPKKLIYMHSKRIVKVDDKLPIHSDM